MEPAFFVIAILGCGEGDAPCTQVRRLDARYESQAACSKATDAALVANGEADYPVVVAQCIAAGQAASEVRPVEIRLPPPRRRAPEPPMKPRRGMDPRPS
jgi:hypothetical protein